MSASTATGDDPVTDVFFKQVMNAAPILPAHLQQKVVSCGTVGNDINTAEQFSTSSQIAYQEAQWQHRIKANWRFFSATPSQGKILVIDQKQIDSQVGYRYLANADTHNQLYEPWSSSKVQAFSGAVSRVRSLAAAQNIQMGAASKVGASYLADMITSINSYAEFSSAPDDSNALATFFANLASRDYLTDLFYDRWLQLDDDGMYFRGAYGPTAFQPSNTTWVNLDTQQSLVLVPYANAQDDPGYRRYLCDTCAKTGNKPMNTLAQAEWLKRLATHDTQADTQMPYLTSDDVNVLFYGRSHSHPTSPVGGMMLGISNMLQIAIAESIANQDLGTNTQEAKRILDLATSGQWRVFQKIGWGPSETRGTSENVVLAHVCLPYFQGGRAFTVAAQSSVPENSEVNVAKAGLLMQSLLTQSMQELINPSTAL